jgi:hypothetical protein
VNVVPGVEANEIELRERLTAILCGTTPLMQVLSVARGLCLPDWLVFSGAVYQPVLNHLTGRPLDYGIKDYDLGYTARATRPPGFITRRTFAKAVAGSLKNMTPNRENDRSKLLGSKAWLETSATITSACRKPEVAIRSPSSFVLESGRSPVKRR